MELAALDSLIPVLARLTSTATCILTITKEMVCRAASAFLAIAASLDKPRDICGLLRSTRECWQSRQDAQGSQRRHHLVVVVDESDKVTCDVTAVVREFAANMNVAAFVVGNGSVDAFTRSGNKPPTVIASWADIEPGEPSVLGSNL